MKENSIKEAVGYLIGYIATYPNQPGYEDYHLETLINDVLYGLGVSISDDYRCADGFEKWKDRLRVHLEKK